MELLSPFASNRRAWSCMTTAAANLNFQPPTSALVIADNVDDLHALGERIVTSSTVVGSNGAIQLAAYRHETHGLGPARKGRQCLKDCIIVETVLAVARATCCHFQGRFALLSSPPIPLSNSTQADVYLMPT